MNVEVPKQKRHLFYYIKPIIIYGGIFLVIYATPLGTILSTKFHQIILWTGLRNPSFEIMDKATLPFADYDMQLQTMEGEVVPLSAFQGKVIIINFWATWCPPCRAEMPTISQFWNEIDRSKVAVLMVSMDDTKDRVERFIKASKYDMPFYMPNYIPVSYDAYTLPTTYIIAPDGHIMKVIKGAADFNAKGFKYFVSQLIR